MGASSNKPKQTSSDTSTPDVSVEKFEIVDGKIRVGQSTANGAGKEHVYDKVNLTAKNISLTSALPFTLTANTPGGGALKLDGQAGPVNSEDAAKTPLDASISVEHADLTATGFIDPASGLAGIVDFNGKVKSDGKKLDSEGKAKAANLRVIKGGQPAKSPLALDYHTEYGLDSQAGTINSQIHTGKSTVSAAGTMHAKGQDTLAQFTGIKPSNATLIQTVSLALRVAPEGIKADNIVLDVPSMGNLTGNGIIASNNALDFKMLLKLSGNAANTLGSLTQISSAVQSRGLPFTITGTTSNPKFLPALGNDLKSGLKDTLLGAVQGKQGQNYQGQKPDLQNALGGLLGKKKKP